MDQDAHSRQGSGTGGNKNKTRGESREDAELGEASSSETHLAGLWRPVRHKVTSVDVGFDLGVLTKGNS